MVSSFILLFNPLITETSPGNNLYLIGLLCLFYFAVAVYQVPYLAWLPELAPQDQQKLTLSSWLAISGLIGTIFGAVGTPWMSARYGFAVMTGVVGFISLASLLLPLLAPERATQKTQPVPLLKALKASWRNSSFRSYVMGVSAGCTAMSILAVCPPFFAIALLHRDISFGALISALVLGGSAFGMMIVSFMARRFGKKRTFQLSMLWTGIGLMLLVFASIWLGPSLVLWMTLIPLSSVGLGCFAALPNAMMPDIIDHDLELGKSAQALYFGSRGLFKELSIGFGTLIVGLLLSLGNTAANPLGVQLSLAAAGGFIFLSAACWMIYPISK
jgi:GPH family glycoside/pentoside/hexuronide:cation symporter